jgi:hypothetical protein
LLGVILYLLGWLSKAEVGKVAAFIRRSSGVLAVGALALLFTRNIGLAILAGMVAYNVMLRTSWYPGKPRGAAPPGVSTVRSLYIEMALDHTTGAITGKVLKGRFAGRALSDFNEAERDDILAELHANDGQGVQLFEAYLDRASPGWRPAGAGAGSRGGGKPSRAMTLDEAYLVLGLKFGATRDDVLAAHRNLMKRFHPDQGGSTYLAAQVNEAKDLILKQIRV